MIEKRDDLASPRLFDLLGGIKTSRPALVSGAGYFVHAQVVQRVCPLQKSGTGHLGTGRLAALGTH